MYQGSNWKAEQWQFDVFADFYPTLKTWNYHRRSRGRRIQREKSPKLHDLPWQVNVVEIWRGTLEICPKICHHAWGSFVNVVRRTQTLRQRSTEKKSVRVKERERVSLLVRIRISLWIAGKISKRVLVPRRAERYRSQYRAFPFLLSKRPYTQAVPPKSQFALLAEISLTEYHGTD